VVCCAAAASLQLCARRRKHGAATAALRQLFWVAARQLQSGGGLACPSPAGVLLLTVVWLVLTLAGLQSTQCSGVVCSCCRPAAGALLRDQQCLCCSWFAASARSLCSVSMCAGVAVGVAAMLPEEGQAGRLPPPPFCSCACSTAEIAGDWLHPWTAVALGCSSEPAACSSRVWCEQLVGKTWWEA
jgi:hypothetical protein